MLHLPTYKNTRDCAIRGWGRGRATGAEACSLVQAYLLNGLGGVFSLLEGEPGTRHDTIFWTFSMPSKMLLKGC